MKNQLTMIMVCLSKGLTCNEDGFVTEVGDKTHLFCCQKGFEITLEDFTKSVGEEKKGFHNN